MASHVDPDYVTVTRAYTVHPCLTIGTFLVVVYLVELLQASAARRPYIAEATLVPMTKNDGTTPDFLVY